MEKASCDGAIVPKQVSLLKWSHKIPRLAVKQLHFWDGTDIKCDYKGFTSDGNNRLEPTDDDAIVQGASIRKIAEQLAKNGIQ